MTLLSPKIVAEAKQHALEAYPQESCGIVAGDQYIRCANVADDPLKDFKIAPLDYLEARNRGPLVAIIHSHPNGPWFPTAPDMQGQINSALPWGIIVTDGERVSDPILWGDQLPIPPLLGRTFVHGITDCYSLVRDSYRLGAAGLAAQNITSVWPLDSVSLPDVPRNDAWWRDDGVDLYIEHFQKFGFRKIAPSEAKPGDAFLMKVRADRVNHAGVLVTPDLIMHHLPNRLSRREPAGPWARHAQFWVRHEVME